VIRRGRRFGRIAQGKSVGSSFIRKESSAAAPAPDIPQTGLILWLKAGEGTYSDAARTTPVSVNASEVKGWADQSGTNNHASAYTANGPVIKTAGQNSKVALTFNVHAMTFANSGTGLTTMEAFIVVKYVGASRILAGGVGSGFDNYLFFNNSLVRFDCRTAIDRGYFVDGSVPSTVDAFLINVSNDASDISCAINGDAPATTTTANKLFDLNAIGKWEGGSGGDPQCDLYEVIVYNVTLSGPDRTAVKAYLNTKYAIY